MKNNKTQKNIINNWQQLKLGNIVDVVSGGTPDTSNDEYWDGNINWITPSEITKTGKYITSETQKKISNLGLKNSSATLIPKNSLILCSRATIGECSINSYPIATNQGFKNLIPGKNILIEFLYYKIKISKKALLRMSSGSTFLEFSKKDIQKLRIDLPEINEQHRIVSVLETWDKAIEKLAKKIEFKKNIKKGLMQRLLAGELRLPGFSESWATVKLGDICEIKKGQDLSKEKLSNDGKNKCILYGELYTRYNDIIDNVLSRTDIDEGVKSIAGDILIPASTTTKALDLAIAICLNEDGVLLGGDINILRQKKKYNSDYLALYLTHIRKHSLARLAQGITIVHLYGKDCKKIQLSMPCIKEQGTIARIIVVSEKEVESLEKKLAVLKQQKNYLLNNLITGVIRTPETMKIKS